MTPLLLIVRATVAAILAAAVGLLVAGCAGPSSRPSGAAQVQNTGSGEWFCQMRSTGDDWECVQDPQLARKPRPDRVPEPASPPGSPGDPGPLPATEPPATGVPATEVPRTAPEPLRTPPPPDRNAGPAAASASPPREAPAVGADSMPDYVRLAYQPPQPIALTELPENFYAVQLIAMSSKEALERFVEQKRISGVSAARVERNGELYYVLLLGIYEDADVARQAVASLPTQLTDSRPWIRPLGSLQAAMHRADSLAGSTRF